jgi:hypothetical protein
MFQDVQAVLQSGKNFQVPAIIQTADRIHETLLRVLHGRDTRLLLGALEDLQTVNRRRCPATACYSVVS